MEVEDAGQHEPAETCAKDRDRLSHGCAPETAGVQHASVLIAAAAQGRWAFASETLTDPREARGGRMLDSPVPDGRFSRHHRGYLRSRG
ncbi:hypothetical protein GCM10007890_37170 [Methylobacterium tardum]|uniref:Uncharacterized protein n=1 Tax=Methylobacterium tardum TaxID=374432 RepID=A0AA37TIE0_9HYPH|nr:hypothetical protein GCM10007890_37170 [Methylobacterium tardum]